VGAVGDAAFVGGCVNEPSTDEQPTMELCVAHLTVRPRHEQLDPSALEHWHTFAREHAEVRSTHLYFVTHKCVGQGSHPSTRNAAQTAHPRPVPAETPDAGSSNRRVRQAEVR
jgi:hypothetical protein